MTPTRVDKLRAMAQADESPHERDIARTMLAGVPIDPPRPPVPAAWPDPWFGGGTSTVSNGGWTNVTVNFVRWAR